MPFALLALLACTSGGDPKPVHPKPGDTAPDTGRDTARDSGDTTPTGPPIRLFYLGSNARGDVGEAEGDHLIYTAVGHDGVTFQEEGVALTTPDGNDPDVFRVGAAWALFTSNGPTLTFATSDTPQGPFSAQSTLSWFGGGGPSTVEIDGTTRLFFCGDGGIFVSALTLDPPSLAPFETAMLNPHPDGRVCDPVILKVADDDWRMFYHWTPEIASLPYQHIVYQARSTDGLHYVSDLVVIRESTSVPGAVRRADGTILLYGVDGVGGGDPDADTGPDPGDTAKPLVSGLTVGMSTDNGTTFTFSDVDIEGMATEQGFDPDAILEE